MGVCVVPVMSCDSNVTLLFYVTLACLSHKQLVKYVVTDRPVFVNAFISF